MTHTTRTCPGRNLILLILWTCGVAVLLPAARAPAADTPELGFDAGGLSKLEWSGAPILKTGGFAVKAVTSERRDGESDELWGLRYHAAEVGVPKTVVDPAACIGSSSVSTHIRIAASP